MPHSVCAGLSICVCLSVAASICLSVSIYPLSCLSTSLPIYQLSTYQPVSFSVYCSLHALISKHTRMTVYAFSYAYLPLKCLSVCMYLDVCLSAATSRSSASHVWLLVRVPLIKTDRTRRCFMDIKERPDRRRHWPAYRASLPLDVHHIPLHSSCCSRGLLILWERRPPGVV